MSEPSAARRDTVLAVALGRVALWSLRLLVIAAGLAVLAWALGVLWMVLLPALLGLFLAAVLWPATNVLRRHSVPPALAALGVLLAAVVVLVGLGAALAPRVVDETQELADSVTGGLEQVQGYLEGPPLNLDDEQLGGAVSDVVGRLQANAQTVAARVLSGAAAAGSALLTAFLAVVLCFFYLKDGPRFVPWLAGLSGPRAGPHVAELCGRVWTMLSGFVRAQAAVGLVDAVFIGLGLVVLGVPLALPLAVLVFFGAFIPIVGAVVTGALAALVALVSDGLVTALIVVGIVLVVQQLEGNVLQPVLVGRSLDLHPAVVILAVTAGGTLRGVVGAFLAVPLVGAVAVAVRYARLQLADTVPGPESPPMPAGQPMSAEEAGAEARDAG
ncbi:AI-2E family transporter [Motilibacter deserti]|uniref:AI-2E family transporter n=1 Tax=Motilibacter deserti TaxID=2714956 RepID=A0ABX0GSX0_9ACTN|nr:AI-2E family transporter [Motilibacter deserti]